MVYPESVVNEEFDRHTQKILRLLNSMKENPEVSKDRIEAELKKHKSEMLEVVEANLVKKGVKAP